MHLRVMSVRQPWATMLARGIKPVENRERWEPPRWAMKSHEPVWIAFHASLGREPLAVFDCAQQLAGVDHRELAYPRGAIVGLARFCGWYDRNTFYSLPAGDHDTYTDRHGWHWADSPWRERGLHALCFTDAIEFPEPIEGVKGQQAVWWRPDEALEAAIRAHLPGAAQREAA